MKTLLLVESDNATREHLAAGVAGMTDELRVLTARQGEEAARVLASGTVDILVTELIMPVMDGFELLSYVLEEYPDLEVVVMGESGWGRMTQALSAARAFRVLDKPVAVSDLVDAVRGILAQPAKGRLTGLSLPGFLQLLSTEGRSCTLEIKAGGKVGHLEMREGELVNAAHDGRDGKRALFEILGWEQAEIEVEDEADSVPRLIHERLPSLLLEAALQKDQEGMRLPLAPGGALDDGQRSTGGAERSPQRVSADEGGESPPLVGSFTTFAAAPLQVEIAAAAHGLRAFMRLEGTLGAGIVEFETGRSLAHVCRGRNSYFADMAAKAATTVREGMHAIDDTSLRQSIRQLKLYGPHQFQLVRVVATQPRLMLFFAGLIDQADVVTASQLLADFERMILSSPAPVAAPQPQSVD